MTCMKIPKEIDVTSDLRIEFKAIRGSNPRSDIGLDNVEVLKECPHRSNSSINPTNGPAFTIRYANASSSALSSLLETRMFEHPGGPFKLTFKYRKSAKEIFQVWMYDHSKNETIQLSKITLPSEDENIHCIDISPDLNGTLSIGFMDTFLPNNMTMDKQISTLIYDFALQEGHCKVPLSARDCTFEDNLCSYTTTDGYGSCTSRYQWQLVESHNKDQGHIMSIMMDENREEMTYLDGASIVFEPFIIDLESRGCSLSFDFSIVNRSTYMGENGTERSVECRFTDGMSCGYNVDKMIWKDGDLSTDPDRKDEGAVFSPPFMFDSDQNCITIGLSGLVMSQFKLALLNSDGENVLWFYETEIAIQQGMSCAQGEFKCNGTCFDNDRLCDGVRDCLDGEDEEGCDCRSDTFSCSTSTECIHNSLYCDGTADCADASDEMCDGSVECDFRLGPSVDVTSSLAYIISPQFTIDVDSCLIVGFLPYYGHNQFLRTAALQNRNLTTTYIPRKMLKTYTTMPNTSISFMTGLGPGGYDGVLIEAQDVDILVHNASIKVNRGLFQSVALMPNPCEALVDNTSSEHRYTSKGYGESTTTHRTQTTRSHTATPNDMQTTMGRTVRLKRGIPQTGTTSNSNITVTQNFSTTIPPSTNNSTQETHSTQEPTTTRRVTTSYSTHETKTKSESTHGSMYTTKSSQETKITTESTQGSISTTNSTQGPNNTSETTQGNAYATNSTQVVYTTSSTQGHKNTSESTQGNMYTTYFTQETKTTTEFTQESMSTTKFAQGSKTTSESTQGPKTTVSSTQRPETTMTSTQASTCYI
ncbi:SSPO-like protein [Mya arenaria]|uniref:SSPO-like protein n=1 Tax=Mya arenaria TaxID=6604 RepID=A0ABY7ENF9_MYAAR|nr:SSPO-like protein [Mya arenaria]